MSILTKWLTKRGIDNPDQLDADEKATYDKYRLILSGELVTVESIKLFCKSQIQVIEGFANGKDPLTMLQQASLHVYLNLLKAIEAPEAERASLERYLNQIINQ